MNHDEVFERLTPPPGGLVLLRERLEVRPRNMVGIARLAYGAAALALVLLYFFVGRERSPDWIASARSFGGSSEIALGLAPATVDAVAISADDRQTTAIAEVRTASPNVAFYWVGSTAWRE